MHLALSWALARTAGGRQNRRPSRFLAGIAPQTQSDAVAAHKPRRARGSAPRCRICNAGLSTPTAIMLRRCEKCPADIDEQLLKQLKEWRLRTATAMAVPAFVVFTDNTLIAIAEQLPTDDDALVAIPGIGARKLEQFGPDVLALVRARSDVRPRASAENGSAQPVRRPRSPTRCEYTVRTSRRPKPSRTDRNRRSKMGCGSSAATL